MDSSVRVRARRSAETTGSGGGIDVGGRCARACSAGAGIGAGAAAGTAGAGAAGEAPTTEGSEPPPGVERTPGAGAAGSDVGFSEWVTCLGMNGGPVDDRPPG